MGTGSIDKINIIREKPEYGKNYSKGYIGFSFSRHIVSELIKYFNSHQRIGDIPVSHAFVVEDENSCIEALIKEGVTRSPLSGYFNDKNTVTFFRKPLDIEHLLPTPIEEDQNVKTNADAIVHEARKHMGNKYSLNTILKHAQDGSHFKNWVAKRIGEKKDLDPSWSDTVDDKWICSELAAYCLQSVPRYANQGVLQNSAEMITPQLLFQDKVILSAWDQKCITFVDL